MITTDISFLRKITPGNFNRNCLEVFKYQSKNNGVYAKYLKLLGIDPGKISKVKDIPFLPIELFKTHEIKTGKWKHETVFYSSGTTGQTRSKHFIRNVDFYLKVAQWNFERFFGPLQNYEIIALLPGYVGKETNSLVTMVSSFIEKTGSDHSGFYLGEHDRLKHAFLKSGSNRKKLLFGVSHALLDFAEQNPTELKNTLVMETGGMKGKKQEIVRSELHEILKERLGVKKIYSEYGMAELTSQGYSLGDGNYLFPPWMSVAIREVSDPFKGVTNGRVGGINVIDLSNFHTCSFIETQDLGRKNGPKLEILGRFDNSDVRGCNILI